MTSNVALIALLVVAWGGFVLLMRKTISVVPVVPFVPAVLLLVGWLANGWIDWSGTIGVAVLHVVAMAIGGVGYRRSRSRVRPPDDVGQRRDA